MALHRGIQSAIFYYVSCAPCAEARVRKRRKQEAERDRAGREALELHMPGLYRQPEPSATNPFWQTEIDAGPIPMRTRRRQVESSKGANSTNSNIASSVSVIASDVFMERSDSAKSGLGPHQRRDEPLWGSFELDGNHLPQQLQRATLNDVQTPQHIQNPAINDMHPPTTRRVQSRDEVAWMLQPPPMPEFMNGKASSVNRSSSNVSRPSASSTSRQSSRRVDRPTSRSYLDGNLDEVVEHSNNLQIPTVSRSKTLPPRSAEALQTIRKPPPSFQLRSNAESSNLRNHHRPSLIVQRFDTSTGMAKNDYPQRAASFNTGTTVAGFTAGKPAAQNLVESRFVVPTRSDLADEYASDSPENFDAWQAPEFELPQWIHEHTKREVRQRWSFDM